ncbi:protein NRT1/ PTR FAMILY 5.7 [Sesamum angolense]|uniref:Protein NRT1/ PTR FAMILY 5.7 n=1 Tax=Sesamum angolense TaxID=2727404 RepID=A0AAE1WMR4_9LAMI|nr:protein NRT1/ PTR FAMILY 5.7 [Sesamum angolense]
MEQAKKLESRVWMRKWVYDSSLDHKGRIPLRASTGAWKASLFIIGMEFHDPREAELLWSSNKFNHIPHEGDRRRPQNGSQERQLLVWCNHIDALLGGFVADAYLGRFSTVLVSSVVYLLSGSSFETLRRWHLSETSKDPRGSFFLAIYLISIGTGGHKPSLESFGADQFDDDHPGERKKKMSFFNWWNFGLCCGLLFGVTIIVYIQDHISWAAADVILTAVMAFTILIFCSGRPFYRFRKPTGSPLTPLLQTQGRLLFHTNKLKFLDKAAIIEDGQDSAEKENPWRLATVTKVEEMKLVVNMIPIWLTTIPFGICVAQASTFFIKQGTTLDRKITHDFMIPPASIYALAAIGMIISVTIYDKLLEPFLRRVTGHERGIKVLQRYRDDFLSFDHGSSSLG